jgi:hypothetical protein
VSKFLEGGERFGISRVSVFDAADVLEISVLWADRCIVESGGYRMSQFDLTVGIREQPGLGALEDAELAALESCGMIKGQAISQSLFLPFVPRAGSSSP